MIFLSLVNSWIEMELIIKAKEIAPNDRIIFVFFAIDFVQSLNVHFSYRFFFFFYSFFCSMEYSRVFVFLVRLVHSFIIIDLFVSNFAYDWFVFPKVSSWLFPLTQRKWIKKLLCWYTFIDTFISPSSSDKNTNTIFYKYTSLRQNTK